jgi:hypothetical protein
VYGFEPQEIEDRVEAWCASAMGSAEAGSGWDRWELEEHVRDESSTFTWLLEPMFERSHFAIQDAVYSEDGFSARYVLERG